ncbi:MAG: ceramidase domain-containing protein [Sphingomonas sp.]|jgi:dihydroceramidase|uniref:ceramidase domain-containing protein n=1 Tax=Sphingomonas sp. TaxID=28214 RepID=UPI00356AA37A
MQPIRARQLEIAAGYTLLIAGPLVWLLMALGPDWSVYAPASCTATRCFCEMPRIGNLILQPANSWSSLGFVFVGFLMIVVARAADRDSAMTPVAATAFGITAIIVGLGSVLLHATLTLWGQFFDVLGMYLVGSFLLVSALARWRGMTDRRAILLYVLLCAALVAVLIMVPEVRRWLFAVVLLAAIVLELGLARPRRPGVRLRFYLAGILVNAIAFAIWNLDQHGLACAPASLIQGHAAWHLLGAVATWLTFAYYRSERTA